VGCCLFRTIEKIRKVVKVSSYKERQRAKGKKHPNARLNLFPHPQPLSHMKGEGRHNSSSPSPKNGRRG
jgi:hypothetical protein